ncbi:acetyl esterase/lipase [Neorhizobium galegae]|uniref:alpha/beta hydrolase fold domain-containing protein n=1 Tax=Rhizobium/Agrobacterium group TaxID=227290 RepID=UPI001AEAE408|nr:alpha/beta hydrolase fold domain-containing protein [Neorhizobium galegae]MBP2551021.1 acetyl esterase/lipase [Neorhizobium galegae]
MPWTDLEIGHGQGQLPVRIYSSGLVQKVKPLVLYLAGRAFGQAAPAEAEQPAARALADSGAVVVEVAYAYDRPAIFPQAIERGLQVLQRLSLRKKEFAGARSKLFVAGDEAGGNIAAGIALKARDYMPGSLSGQVLLSPLIDPEMASASIRRADEIGMRQRWTQGWSQYLQQACGYGHPYAAPCLCSRLSGVAPALVMSAEDDPLRDEILAYARRLGDGGVFVRQHILAAGQGWTGIYTGQDGRWRQEITEAFAAFAAELT